CISIRSDQERAAKHYVEISDTGAGIPNELMDLCFERLVTGKEHVCGLDLSIFRRIVREHGGVISAANRPEGGAIFCVELPRHMAHNATARLNESQESLLV